MKSHDKLIVIDFDLTIVSEHTPGKIEVAAAMQNISIINDSEALKKWQWEQVKNIPPVGSAEKWNQIISTALQLGHIVSIASSNPYPHIIEQYLREVIKLDKQVLEHIKIVTVDKAISQYKNKHLEKIKKCVEFSGFNNNVILIDDDEDNIEHAQKAGYATVQANEIGDHLVALSQMLDIADQKKEVEETQTDMFANQGPYSTGKLAASYYQSLKHSIFYRKYSDKQDIVTLGYTMK